MDPFSLHMGDGREVIMSKRRSHDEGAESRRPRPEPKSAGPSQRQLRVGELIRHELSRMLARAEIHDEVLTKYVVTIPEVRMSTDLKIATAYVMPLGGGNAEAVIAALAKNKTHIRAQVAKAVNLKYAPDLRFLEDQSFAETERIERLLASDKVRRDIGKA